MYTARHATAKSGDHMVCIRLMHTISITTTISISQLFENLWRKNSNVISKDLDPVFGCYMKYSDETPVTSIV